MPSCFSPPPTAEQVVQVVDAVTISPCPSSVQYVADFCDLLPARAESALMLASKLGFIAQNASSDFEAISPLCRLLVTQDEVQKAVVLRILLEAYEPFTFFRSRIGSVRTTQEAARHTRTACLFVDDPDDISATLISLGTYAQALRSSGGGKYEPQNFPVENALKALMEGCNKIASAEERIKLQLGAEAVSLVSPQEVISPLANALLRASGGDGRGAVVEAGNAAETFLVELGNRLGVDLTGKTGINSKAEAIKRDHISKMPTKLLNVARYIGHIRNAADHGNDQDINMSWHITEDTGVQYVFVTCSFIASTITLELGGTAHL